MKQQIKKYNRFVVVTLSMLALSVTILTTLVSFTVKKYTDDFWGQLGMSEKEGSASISQSFLQGYLYNYGAKSAKNIASGNRAAVTKDLLTYTKQYVSSEAFKKEYEKARLAAKPGEPYRKTARTKDEIRKEQVDQIQKSITEIEKNMSTYTPDVKKIMEPLLETQKQQLKEYKDPNNQIIELMYEGEKSSVENDWKYYKESLKNWEEEHPVNPDALIKKRLQQYLDLVNTVDFSATLKDVNGRKKFVNPTYEAKSGDWKKIYRAGKEVNDVVKPFTATWIKEL